MPLPILRKIDSALGLAEGGAHAVLIGSLCLALAICLIYQGLSIAHRYPLDYGEAPLVDQAMRLTRAKPLYRSDLSTPPYTISNYPPGFILALAPFVKLFGPNFWAGRVISALGALVSALFIGMILKSLTQDRLAALVGSLTLLAFPFVVKWSGLLRIDLLALALSLGGLALLAGHPESRRTRLAGGLLLVGAIFTRQSYALAAPLAGFVWLLAYGWRAQATWGKRLQPALELVLWVAGLSGALFMALNILTHGGFYFNIVTANVNEFTMDRLKWNLEHLQRVALGYLVIGGVTLLSPLLELLGRFITRRIFPGKPLPPAGLALAAWPLLVPYTTGAALSALTIGKIGSNVNYFLELCAALSLSSGFLLAWSRRQPVHAVRLALLASLVVGTGHLMKLTNEEVIPQLAGRRAVVGQLQELESAVAQAQGPILADEYMGMATLQGRPLVLQPFEVTQLAWAGLWDQTPLLDSIRNQEYPLILIHYFPDFPVYKERWTQQMLDAINDAYAPQEQLADTRVYRPRPRVHTGQSCPGAPWQLPTSAILSVQWSGAALDFFGLGNEGQVPVYAAADGLLTRPADWTGAVAVLSPDPLRPGEKVWVLYGDMLSEWQEPLVSQEYPPGSTSVPVKAGQLLGYQGRWSSADGHAVWLHLHFALVPATKGQTQPPDFSSTDLLDPSLYLGLALKPASEQPYSQDFKCGGSPASGSTLPQP